MPTLQKCPTVLAKFSYFVPLIWKCLISLLSATIFAVLCIINPGVPVFPRTDSVPHVTLYILGIVTVFCYLNNRCYSDEACSLMPILHHHHQNLHIRRVLYQGVVSLVSQMRRSILDFGQNVQCQLLYPTCCLYMHRLPWLVILLLVRCRSLQDELCFYQWL